MALACRESIVRLFTRFRRRKMKSLKSLACTELWVKVLFRFTYICEVTVVEQLHLQQDVDQELALWQLHHRVGARLLAVKLLLKGLASLNLGWLGLETESLKQVG